MEHLSNENLKKKCRLILSSDQQQWFTCTFAHAVSRARTHTTHNSAIKCLLVYWTRVSYPALRSAPLCHRHRIRTATVNGSNPERDVLTTPSPRRNDPRFGLVLANSSMQLIYKSVVGKSAIYVCPRLQLKQLKSQTVVWKQRNECLTLACIVRLTSRFWSNDIFFLTVTAPLDFTASSKYSCNVTKNLKNMISYSKSDAEKTTK